jgi:hypothetical protein
MTELTSHLHSAPGWRKPEFAAMNEAAYAHKVNALARSIIYEKPDPSEIERALEEARRDPGFGALERERHGIESLSHLLKGIEAHEKANLFFGGAWQAALIRQKGHPNAEPKPPETLTRRDAAEEFEAFPFREQLVTSEQEAVMHYSDLLKTNPEDEIAISQNIALRRTDMEALINDLNVRMAERIPDSAVRKAELKKCDDELARIITRVSDRDWGKRFELEEIYLLRRLIHSVDTGHLVAVNHGTPRQDLRPDQGSVDVEMTVAGDRYGFQLKTFKSGVSGQTRERQRDIFERASRVLRDQPTHLVILEAESVQDAYERSLRQKTTARTSRRDKFDALEPLTSEMTVRDRSKLLYALGLTEDDLAAEQKAFERRQAELLEQQKNFRKREAERMAAEAGVERKKEEERRRNEEEELAKIRMIKEHIKRSRIQAEEARKKEEMEKEKRAEERKKRKRAERMALERQIAEREAKERGRAEKEAKRKAERLRRERKKTEVPGWPPKNLSGLFTAPVLQALHLLPRDWDGDARALLEAKKRIIALTGAPKKKGAAATEADKPNPLFKRIFPSKQLLESPTQEVLRQLEDSLDKDLRV